MTSIKLKHCGRVTGWWPEGALTGGWPFLMVGAKSLIALLSITGIHSGKVLTHFLLSVKHVCN